MVRLGPHEFDYVHCWQRRIGVSTCLVSEVPSLKNYYLDIRLLVLWYDYHCDHWLLGWHSATLTTDNVGYVHLLRLGIAMIRPDCRATEQLLKCQRTLQIEQFYVINFSGSHPPWQTWIRTKGKVQKKCNNVSSKRWFDKNLLQSVQKKCSRVLVWMRGAEP